MCTMQYMCIIHYRNFNFKLLSWHEEGSKQRNKQEWGAFLKKTSLWKELSHKIRLRLKICKSHHCGTVTHGAPPGPKPRAETHKMNGEMGLQTVLTALRLTTALHFMPREWNVWSARERNDWYYRLTGRRVKFQDVEGLSVFPGSVCMFCQWLCGFSFLVSHIRMPGWGISVWLYDVTVVSNTFVNIYQSINIYF